MAGNNRMLQGLKSSQNVAYTENGARAYKTTENYLLDFFGLAGAMRERSWSDVLHLFTKAYGEDPLRALKALFYFRDVRGGQGERKTPRAIIKYLAQVHPDAIGKNVGLIPEFGRWDDLYELFGTPAEHYAADLIRAQWNEDIRDDVMPTLLGKWLKSENTSSKESVELARKTRKILGLSPKEYRQSLAYLRKRIGILEDKLRRKAYHEIDYSKLPSQAGMKYRKAFFRNDETGYKAFLDLVEKGEKKINASTLAPYEIVRKVPDYSSYSRPGTNGEEERTLNALWEALPDYVQGNNSNVLVASDVSASMKTHNGALAYHVSVSLGLYFAERNKGPFQDHLMIFDTNPYIVEATGSTFCEKVRNIRKQPWDGSTNIEGVFDLLLNTAIAGNMTQEDIPSKVIIVSDMEFNAALEVQYNHLNRIRGGWNGMQHRPTPEALFETIRKKFEARGYVMPKLVFWNVNARNDQFPMKGTDYGAQFVSGCNPTIFKNILAGQDMDAYQLMLDVLDAERYAAVTL